MVITIFIIILEQSEIIGRYLYTVNLSTVKECFALLYLLQVLSQNDFPVNLRIIKAIYRRLKFTIKLWFQDLYAKLGVLKTWLFVSVGFPYQLTYVFMLPNAIKYHLWCRRCQTLAWRILDALGTPRTSLSTTPGFDLEYNSSFSDIPETVLLDT